VIESVDTGRDEKGKFIKGSKVNLGYVHSTARREKFSARLRGVVLSDGHKENIRIGMLTSDKTIGRPKGGIPWNKGMKRINGDPIPTYTYPELSEESKRHKSEARMGKHYSSKTEFKKGMVPWNTGKQWDETTLEKMRAWHPTEESKAKMSKSHMGKELTAEHIRKCLTRRTPTSLEKKFLDIVEKNGLPYKFVGDGSFMIGRKNPDFININGDKIAIEVYARYYKLRHAETVQEWMDERQKVFREYGWTGIFFDETQVTEKNVLKQLGIV